MFASAAKPFYRSATILELSPIPLTTYGKFVRTLFKKGGKDVENDAIATVYEKMEAVTLYMQRVFHDAFSETPPGEICTNELVHKLIERYVEENSSLFKVEISSMNSSQQGLLSAIAKECSARGITSSGFVRKHSLKSASAVQAAAKKLIQKDILKREDDSYSISDPLFKLYLTR